MTKNYGKKINDVDFGLKKYVGHYGKFYNVNVFLCKLLRLREQNLFLGFLGVELCRAL